MSRRESNIRPSCRDQATTRRAKGPIIRLPESGRGSLSGEILVHLGGLDADVEAGVGVRQIVSRGSVPLHPSTSFVRGPDDEREGGYDCKLGR
jgi:hypothetical protein